MGPGCAPIFHHSPQGDLVVVSPVCPNALAAAHCRLPNPSREDDSWADVQDAVFGESLDGLGFVRACLLATRDLIPER
jgi:hypothetical protein